MADTLSDTMTAAPDANPTAGSLVPAKYASDRFNRYNTPTGIVVENSSGQVVFRVPKSQIEAFYEQQIKDGKMTAQDAFRDAQNIGFTGGAAGEDGGFSLGNPAEGSGPGGANPGAPPTSRTSSSGTTSTPKGTSSRPGGLVSPSGGGGGGATGGGLTVSRGGAANVTGGGGPGVTLSGESSSVSAGGGGGGATNIDPNAPLGFPGGGPGSGPVGGSDAFRSNTFPGVGSILEGIDENSSLNDIIRNIVTRQESNRDAALGIYGGAYDLQRNDPTLQGTRARAQELLANPFSLDDRTVQRIHGTQHEKIGQTYAKAAQNSADRAAARGAGRGGLQAAQQDRFAINAEKDSANALRGLQIEQATRRPQELASAINTAGGFGQSDVGQAAGIAQGAANNVYGQTSIMGDALLSGVLMGGGPQPIKIGDRANPWNPVGYVNG